MNYSLIFSCENLYKKALIAVTKTKQTFFDSNPSGRILNRFSRDTYLMDYTMPIYFQDFFQNFWLLLGYLVALIIFVPFNLISLAVNLFIIYYFRSISISKAR